MSQHLHLRAFTGRPASIARQIAGHGVNPASQPLLSRMPALTLAESYAAGDAYEYRAAFDRAARAVLGEELAERVGRDLLDPAGSRPRPARRAPRRACAPATPPSIIPPRGRSSPGWTAIGPSPTNWCKRNNCGSQQLAWLSSLNQRTGWPCGWAQASSCSPPGQVRSRRLNAVVARLLLEAQPGERRRRVGRCARPPRYGAVDPLPAPSARNIGRRPSASRPGSRRARARAASLASIQSAASARSTAADRRRRWRAPPRAGRAARGWSGQT